MNKNKFFVPFQNEPEIQPKQWTEFEDIWEYDSKKENIIQTGEQRNIQVEIDSFKDQTLIYNILDKYVGIGSNPEMLKSIPELNKKQGQYMDISKLPKNIHEVNKLGQLAEQQLKELEKNTNDMENQTLFGHETNIQETKKTEQRIEERNEKNSENK